MLILIGSLVGLGALILIARWVITLPAVVDFVATYPGVVRVANAPTGFPAWLNWQHFLNIMFLALIVRTALSIRSKKRPPFFFTRRNTGLIRTSNLPRRMSIHVWTHLSVDVLWVLNGILYIVLLFTTGQWLRIVPTSWDVLPNAASAALQYLALDWPTENAWVTYNSIQLLAYFVTVFVAAPIAILTGVRLSNAWPARESWIRAVPERPVRWVHNATLVYFLVFVVFHVFLVVSTGILRNLNMMFAGNDGEGWVGLILAFLALDLVMAVWMLLTPQVVSRIARLFGKVQ